MTHTLKYTAARGLDTPAIEFIITMNFKYMLTVKH